MVAVLFSTSKTVSVGSSSSSSDGFTSSQLSKIEDLYDGWDAYINELKSTSTRLKYNTTWRNMSDDLRDEMEKIINDDSDKLYDNYDEFEDGFNDWYSYTIKNK